MNNGFFNCFVSLVLGLVIFGSLRNQQPQAPVSPAALPSPLTSDTPKLPEKTPKLPDFAAKSSYSRKYGSVSLNVSRGIQVSFNNRSRGRISVTGWDRDEISAKSFSQRGQEAVVVSQSLDGSEQKVGIKADYADLQSSDPAQNVLGMPPLGDDGPIQIHLEVNVPKYAMIDVIRVMRSEVRISNIDTPVTVAGESSTIVFKRVGAVEVHTREGNIEIEEANGLVEATTASGAIHVSGSRVGLRAVSIVGPIEVKCARGRVDVSNTNAPIDLYDIDGDVDAIAANSNVRLIGALGTDRRYYLKSMSGRVEMVLPANTSGFNVTLSSYRGTVESDFPLRRMTSLRRRINRGGEKEIERRLSGQFGRGGSQIMLDSFEGVVRLTRDTSRSTTSCK